MVRRRSSQKKKRPSEAKQRGPEASEFEDKLLGTGRPVEDDDGFHASQLILSLWTLVNSARKSRRFRVADRQFPPEVKLLRCVQKVLDLTSTRHLQRQILDAILSVCATEKKSDKGRENVDAKMQVRQEFWTHYRVNTQKWEGRGCVPKQFFQDVDDEQYGNGEHAAQCRRPRTAGDNKKAEVHAAAAAAAAATQGKYSPSFSSISRPSSAPVQMRRTAFKTLSQLCLNKQEHELEDTGSSVGRSRFSDDIGSRFSLESRAAPDVCVQELSGFSASRPRPNRLQRAADTHGSRSTSRLLQERSLTKERSYPVSGTAARFPQGRASVGERSGSVHRARLRLTAPNSIGIDQQSSLMSCGDDDLETTLLPHEVFQHTQLSLAKEWQSLHKHRSLPQESQKAQIPLKKEHSLHKHRPAMFPALFDGKSTATIVSSCKWIYFKECERLGIHPHVPSFLFPSRSGTDENDPRGQRAFNFDIQRKNLSDLDLEAFTEPLQSMDESEMSFDLHLSGNGFSDGAIGRFLGRFQNYNIRQLCASYTGFGMKSFAVMNRCLQAQWTELHTLELAGTCLSDESWKELCGSVVKHNRLVRLNLADTSLGRTTQSPVHHVARLMGSAKRLDYLDLSGNFFFHEAFEALAEAVQKQETLRVLDISHNASTSLVPPRRCCRSADGTCQSLPNFNPVVLLCEALSHNESLLELRLVGSGLDYSADCALLNSLLENHTLKILDVSENPHGEDGLRALVRLMVHPDQGLEFCNIENFRAGSSPPGSGIIRIDFAAPSGHYELELSHPQHRAIVRWLLRAAAASGLQQPLDAFKVTKWNTAAGAGPEWCWCENGKDIWGVAAGGRLGFDVTLTHDLSKESSPRAAVAKWVRSQREPVSLGRFMPLLAMFCSVPDAQKIIILKAMADTLMLRSCYVRKLMQSCEKVAINVASSLYAHITDGDHLMIFDLIKNETKDDARQFLRDARSTYFLNLENPTGRYILNLGVPMERSVAEKLQVLNCFEQLFSWRTRAVDNSQHGNHEGARNVSWEDGSRNTVVTSLASWLLPWRGTLHLDFVSPYYRAPSRAAHSTTDICVGDLLEILDSSLCCQEDKLHVLHTMSHQLVLTPQQVHRICSHFLNPHVHMCIKSKLKRLVHAIAKTPILKQIALGKLPHFRSAFQFPENENCRADAFVGFFNRCREPPALCTHECLWDQTLFTATCSNDIRSRLGYSRTFDAVNCCQPYGKGLLSAASMGMASKSCIVVSAAASASVRAELRKENSTLSNLMGPSRPGSATSHATWKDGRSYELKLSCNDDWKIAKFILVLANTEPGINLIHCNWTGRGALANTDIEFQVPNAWLTDLPTHGVLTCTYVTEKLEYVRLDDRRSLAEELFGWEKTQS